MSAQSFKQKEMQRWYIGENIGLFKGRAGDEIWGASVYEPPNASANPLSKEIYERAEGPFL